MRDIHERTNAERAKYRELRTYGWITFNHFEDEDSILANFAAISWWNAQRESLDGFCYQTFDSIPNEFRLFHSVLYGG